MLTPYSGGITFFSGTSNDAPDIRHLREELGVIHEDMRRRPNDVSLYIRRAGVLTKLGKFQAAKHAYNTALRIDSKNAELNCKLALFALSFGVADEARSRMPSVGLDSREFLATKIDIVVGHMTTLEKLRLEQDFAAVLKEIDASIVDGIENSKMMLVLRAEMLFQLNRFTEAEEVIFEAHKLEPEPYLLKFVEIERKSYANYVHAQINMALSKYANAIAEAQEAVNHEKGNREIATLLSNLRKLKEAADKGKTFFNKGDFIEAKKQYLLASDLADSKNLNLLNNIAACHMKLEEWEQCIIFCQAALKIQPDDYRALGRHNTAKQKIVMTKDALTETTYRPKG